MKKISSLILSFLFVSFTYAQILNGGFENWTGGQPDSWTTSNSPLLYTNITRTTDAYSGSYALRGDVISTDIPGLSVINPFITSGTNGKGFSINKRYAKISGYYIFNADSGDKFIANITMMKAGKPIASGIDSLTSVASYKLFEFSLNYSSSETPDTCIIQFIILGKSGNVDYHVGSYFILDNLSLSGTATGIISTHESPRNYILYQNYPNPFNPETSIKYFIPQSGLVSLTIYNVLGLKIRTLTNEFQPAGIHMINFNAVGLSSGIYFYMLQVNNFEAVKKLILIK